MANLFNALYFVINDFRVVLQATRTRVMNYDCKLIGYSKSCYQLIDKKRTWWSRLCQISELFSRNQDVEIFIVGNFWLAPSIPPPRVRVPSTPSTLSSIYWTVKCGKYKINKKRPGLAHFFKKTFDRRWGVCPDGERWILASPQHDWVVATDSKNVSCRNGRSGKS